MGYNLFIPSPLWAVSSLLPVALVGVQARGFPLTADGEAAGERFPAESLVYVLPDLMDSTIAAASSCRASHSLRLWIFDTISIVDIF